MQSIKFLKISGKKGLDPMEAFGKIIIILAGFIVVSALISFYFAQNLGSAEASGACRASTILRGNIELDKFGNELKPINTICKTFDHKLSGNQLSILSQISELSADCWWMFANGNYGDTLCGGQIAGVRKCASNQCFPCYTFTIKSGDDFKTFSGAELREFMKKATYIVRNDKTKSQEGNTREPAKGTAISYLDYIQYSDLGLLYISRDFETEADMLFEPGKSYAIYYLEPHNPRGPADGNIFSKIGKNAIYLNYADATDLGCDRTYGAQGS